ncbi:hypothetical protein Clacol_006586 [Clathrus columnatus]|uniref:Uncharacterized protein n=1 Tax=Clathrus columnatus TaxID=1419009 RepID=A0AAV5AD85_9AGAM|nr:hypothetical protein Clacol_006586 [Clathrus columnatus]
MTSASSNLPNPNPPKTQTAAYEFTKRKRWTDTLFSEISEAIFLIVSPSFKVLYCSSAVVEILGWKEDQLVDADLGSFIEGLTHVLLTRITQNNPTLEEDLQNFLWAFTEVLRLGNGLFTYIRFKFEHPPSMTSVPSLLFEVKGRVHYFPGQLNARCVLLSAMPYPSRDITLLNSFLELRMENERLSRRISEMKHLIESSVHEQDIPSSALSQTNRCTQGNLINNSPSLYTSTSTSSSLQYTCSDSSKLGLSNHALDPLEDVSFNPDVEYDEIQRKKKKTIIGEEQRGPHGPKTLCNACGLRWAKRTRKEEPEMTTILKTSSVIASEDSSALRISQQSAYDVSRHL